MSTNSTSKLHELLAVENNLKTQASTTRSDLQNTFGKKIHLFGKKLITFTASTEGSAPVTEEQSDIQSTVGKEVAWISDILAKSFDASHQIDVANTLAKADIVVEDGTTIAKDVPATSLLQLEKRLQEVRELAVTIPTLDPAKGFSEDSALGKGYYAARVVNKKRTKKVEDYRVIVQPTKEHPAQVVKVVEDVVTGTISEQEWSSLITPAMKSDIIDRVDILLRATKQARARANDYPVDVISHKIGKKLLDYIFAPLKG